MAERKSLADTHDATAPDRADGLPVRAERCLPHRPPMLLVDVLRRADGGDGCATARIVPGGLFLDGDGNLDPAAFIEMIAQTYAAVRGHAASDPAQTARTGYLVGVQRADISGRARLGDELAIEVRTSGEFAEFYVVDGTVSKEGVELCAARIKLYAPEEDDATY